MTHTPPHLPTNSGAQRHTSCSVPGKLMIAGEYSVLLPGGSALAIAVDDRLTITLHPSSSDVVYSSALGIEAGIPDSHGSLRYVFESLRVFRSAHVLPPMEIHIDGTMGQLPSGQKLGLGSSAAVCVGIIGAGYAWRFGSPPEPSHWFALAHEAHTTAQGKLGSGYDVATQIVGGVVTYRPRPIAQPNVDDAPDMTDPAWTAQSLDWPVGLHWCAIFSGSGANTRSLVQKALRDPHSRQFLEQMRTACHHVILSWQTGSLIAVLDALDNAQRAFETWDRATGVGVFPAHVAAICDAARACGAIPRVSGAGGGDCILVFADNHSALDKTLDNATAMGGTAVSLAINNTGSSVVCVN